MLGGNLALLEGRHNHPGHLTDAPPQENEGDTDGGGKRQDLNDTSHTNLTSDSIDDTLEVSTGYDGGARSSRQNTSFQIMGAGAGLEPTAPEDETGMLTTTLSRGDIKYP